MTNYRNWVDRGRKPPPHRHYSAYITWVIEKADVKRTLANVTAVSRRNGKWAITHEKKGIVKTSVGFDGVVFTGSGPALSGFDRDSDIRIINGVDFWTSPDQFLKKAQPGDAPIVIAGSGGTSAAIAAWIARNKREIPVLIIGNQAALFTRTESFFENALFSDDQAWAALNVEERISVTKRLTRGVVWSSVSDILSSSADISFRPGRVKSVSATQAIHGQPSELSVEVLNNAGTINLPASFVIDAAGFDAWWFLGLLPADLREAFQGVDPSETRKQREKTAEGIAEDLSLPGKFTGLHVPMLSAAQGPGFASLMVLGSMSERILASYVAS
nr:SidA/IucD/PvdA family monooxygenase [Bosea sp. ASV33]